MVTLQVAALFESSLPAAVRKRKMAERHRRRGDLNSYEEKFSCVLLLVDQLVYYSKVQKD